MSRLFFILAILFVFVAPSIAIAADEISMQDLSGLLDQATESAKSFSVPGLDAGRGPKAAEEAFEQFRSPEYQAQIQAEQARLQEELFKDFLPDKGEYPASAPGLLGDSERVYLFFSSSVPLTTMRAYLAAVESAADPNVMLVMRGFVGGMKTLKPTLDYLAGLLNTDPACDMLKTECDAYEVGIQIDPLLFARYGVNEVPTVAFATDVPRTDGSESEATGPAFVISGDAGLDYLLERINREAQSQTLESLIRRLQGGINSKTTKGGRSWSTE